MSTALRLYMSIACWVKLKTTRHITNVHCLLGQTENKFLKGRQVLLTSAPKGETSNTELSS